jgi:hypothetical protein
VEIEMRRTLLLTIPFLSLAACAPPPAAPMTDCARVASWVQAAIQTKDAPPADGSQDEAYEAAVAQKKKVQDALTEHERKFAESLQTKLNNPGPQDYAAIYALCRKWESGNY